MNQLDRIERKVDGVLKILEGPKGLIVDVALLKQRDRSRSWWVKSTAGAMIVAAATIVLEKLRFIMPR